MSLYLTIMTLFELLALSLFRNAAFDGSNNALIAFSISAMNSSHGVAKVWSINLIDSNCKQLVE